MPQTKTQNFIFTLMNVILMAYFMIVYSIVLNTNEFTNQTFIYALKEFPLEAILVFILAYFIAGPLAKKNAFKIIDKEKDNKIFMILFIQATTVCIMVILMSIYALFIQNLINENIICNYIVLLIKNFIMALPLQIFIVGPITRNIFRSIVKN